MTTSASKSKDAFGAVVGGGLSTFISDRTVLSVEGLYYFFDEKIDFNEGGHAELGHAYSVMATLSFRVSD